MYKQIFARNAKFWNMYSAEAFPREMIAFDESLYEKYKNDWDIELNGP